MLQSSFLLAEAAVTPEEKVVFSTIPLIVIPKRKSAREGKFVNVNKIKAKLGKSLKLLG